MNCLWLILLLFCCGGNSDCERVGNQSCGCTRRRDRDDDCGCTRSRERDDDCGCSRRTSVPGFSRCEKDTCGCECQDD